jgi:hypothetical protein
VRGLHQPAQDSPADGPAAGLLFRAPSAGPHFSDWPTWHHPPPLSSPVLRHTHVSCAPRASTGFGLVPAAPTSYHSSHRTLSPLLSLSPSVVRKITERPRPLAISSSPRELAGVSSTAVRTSLPLHTAFSVRRRHLPVFRLR